MRFTWMYLTSSVDFVIYKILYVSQVNIRFFSDDRLNLTRKKYCRQVYSSNTC